MDHINKDGSAKKERSIYGKTVKKLMIKMMTMMNDALRIQSSIDLKSNSLARV